MSDNHENDLPEDEPGQPDPVEELGKEFSDMINGAGGIFGKIPFLSQMNRKVDRPRSDDIIDRFLNKNNTKETLRELVEIINDEELHDHARFLALCRYDEKVQALKLLACLPDKDTAIGKTILALLEMDDVERLLSVVQENRVDDLDYQFNVLLDNIYTNPDDMRAFWDQTGEKTTSDGVTVGPPPLVDLVVKTLQQKNGGSLQKVDFGKTESGSVLSLIVQKTGKKIASSVLNSAIKILGQDKASMLPILVSIAVAKKIAERKNLSKYQLAEIRRFIQANGFGTADEALTELRMPAGTKITELFQDPGYSPFEEKIAKSRKWLKMRATFEMMTEDFSGTMGKQIASQYQNAWSGITRYVNEFKQSNDKIATAQKLGAEAADKALKAGKKVLGGARDLLKGFRNK